MQLLFQYLIVFGWGVVGAITMAVALAILLKIFTVLTPKIDEMEELKKGNVAVGIMLAGVVIAFAIVVAMCMFMPPRLI
jgi:uncharacterized membrane protein YjfL (UPF0719 family)